MRRGENYCGCRCAGTKENRRTITVASPLTLQETINQETSKQNRESRTSCIIKTFTCIFKYKAIQNVKIVKGRINLSSCND